MPCLLCRFILLFMDNRMSKVESIRAYMVEGSYDAFIVTGGDSHMSEYVASRWRTRAWASGFTGSAGTVVFTDSKAGLWTDFRYWIQGKQELAQGGIDLFEAGKTGVIPFIDWIASELKEGDRAAVQASTVPASMALEWKKRLAGRGIDLVDAGEIPDELWPDRPGKPSTPLYTLPLSITGQNRNDKIDRLRDLLLLQECRGTFLSSLDDIAWLLNIRAMDVKMNPVALAFCFVGEKEVILFTDEKRIKGEVREELAQDGVEIRPYEAYRGFLSSCDLDRLYLSRERNSWEILCLLPDSVETVDGPELTSPLKSQKNEVEVECFRKAMVQDGAAMVNFICWLKNTLGQETVTETSASAKLREFRAEREGFVEESFTPIPAYGEHGALCHYDAAGKDATILKEEGLFLLDSGGQYNGATTDITRTFALGEPTEQERTDYTLVLKGHIALSRAVFPEGTKGFQLDLLARKPLWDRYMDYGHGTGHGVGAFLNVHEGPHSISTRPLDKPILLGTVTSNEPGLYREGSHGIRIENLILTVERRTTDFGRFFSFETLTLCPYERCLIDSSLLDRDEIDWINRYHGRVKEELGPLVTGSAAEWLEQACSPLT